MVTPVKVVAVGYIMIMQHLVKAACEILCKNPKTGPMVLAVSLMFDAFHLHVPTQPCLQNTGNMWIN